MSNEVLVDIYDSEIPLIEGVLAQLNAKVGKPMVVENFRKEAIERFAEIGFKVLFRTFDTTQPGLYTFEVDIVDRMEPEAHGFDHAKQSWEIQHALLGIDTPGAMTPSGFITPPKSVSMNTKKT